MGPTLAVMAKRAAQNAGIPLDVVAASRFSNSQARQWLEQSGVRTIACDLMVRSELNRLPDAENLIYMLGMKFGTTENPGQTWVLIPCRRPTSVSVFLAAGL